MGFAERLNPNSEYNKKRHPKVEVLPEAPKEAPTQKPAFSYKVCWFKKLIRFLKGGK